MRASVQIAAAAMLLTALPSFASTHLHHRVSLSHHHGVAAKKIAAHPQAIDGARATAIQQALIQRGYLTGEPTGQWDSQTAAAMQKLQGDNGWQTKITPDSRALIKLGLGSNPASASVSETPGPGAQ